MITSRARAYSFLNDVARVAARDYEPSDADVVRARLRTMGVQEYRFKPDKGPLRTVLSHIMRRTDSC